MQVDPVDSNIIAYGNGVYSGALQSHRFLSFNAGNSFVNIDGGISACGDWFPEIRISPIFNSYYTACEKNVYYSNSHGLTWSLMNPSNTFVSDVWDFTVNNDSIVDPTLYACLGDGSLVKLMVYD